MYRAAMLANKDIGSLSAFEFQMNSEKFFHLCMSYKILGTYLHYIIFLFLPKVQV